MDPVWLTVGAVAVLLFLRGRSEASTPPPPPAPGTVVYTDEQGNGWVVTPGQDGDYYTPVCSAEEANGAQILETRSGPDGRLYPAGTACIRPAPSSSPRVFTPEELAAFENERQARVAARVAAEQQALEDFLGMSAEEREIFQRVAAEGSPPNRADRVRRLLATGALEPLPTPRTARGAFGSDARSPLMEWSREVKAIVAQGLDRWATLPGADRLDLMRDYLALPRTTINALWARIPTWDYGRSPVAFNALVARWRPPPRLTIPVLRVRPVGVRLASGTRFRQ